MLRILLLFALGLLIGRVWRRAPYTSAPMEKAMSPIRRRHAGLTRRRW